MRKYSVKEIDALRQVVKDQYLYGSYAPWKLGDNLQSRAYKESELHSVVEAQVRTLMAAGLTAEELISSVELQ